MSPVIISTDDLHRIFKNLDKNNEGRVSVEELHHLLDKIGIHTKLDELEKLVGRTSLDYIDFFFFYDIVVKSRIADDQRRQEPNVVDDDGLSEDLRKAFEVFDLNGDGYISCEELQSVLTRLGLWDKRSGQDCKDMIRVYDENSDGLLDFDEFKNMMSVNPPTSDDDDHSETV